MANYYATVRSNYFKVKDADKFKSWIDRLGLELFENKDGVFGFGSMDEGLPTCVLREDGEYDDVDVVEDISEYLAEGEVAIIQEIGSEKLRYLVGYAVAIDWKNEKKWVNLCDIYDIVGEKYGKWGKDISRCEY